MGAALRRERGAKRPQIVALMQNCRGRFAALSRRKAAPTNDSIKADLCEPTESLTLF
ncbi:protein of unknown function [Pseudomonas sp. JV551A1]|uniref:Uncharacterized protein n=1 Tax=Pseudomonas inefficax TaxID=2078786 RepID=A0AAQ1P7E7_9PSED|nr:protein of unknown function [Pseudomonas sp. JV551A1]SPO59208.1 protein of unknown function [Pseudomonas inefficax]